MGGSCDDLFLPLRVVLGALAEPSLGMAGASSLTSSSLTAGATTAATGMTAVESSSSNKETSIMSTSYFATPRLSNSTTTGGRRAVHRLNKDGRVPMEDRKGPFDQFKPKSLVLSTVRVTALNISTTLSNYFSDQLASEQKMESMVESGEITPAQADEMNEEWENREWKVRTEALPKRIGWAIARFHACTALMRFYELVMARYVLCIDGDGRNAAGGTAGHERAVDVMDKLTRDPFQASLRTSQIVKNQEHSPGKVVAPDGTEVSTNREVTRRMFNTCIWANIIPFLAELTVQQGVLVYGYGVYYMAKKRRKERRAADSSQCEDEDGVSESAYALSVMHKSVTLSFSRVISWIAASAGGALGCTIYPGWGTVFGIQIGDTVVGALMD